MRKRSVVLIVVIAVTITIIYSLDPFDKFDHSAVSEQVEVFEGDINSTAQQLNDSFPSPDKTLYRMSVYLDIESQTLEGKTIIETVNTTNSALNELWFTLYPNAFKDKDNSPAPTDTYFNGFNQGYLNISSISVNDQAVEYYIDGISMQVLIPFDVISGQKITVEMEWQDKIPQVAYRFGYKDGVYMLGNFYPALNVFDEKGWHVSYNSAFGDPFCYPCADYVVMVNIPEVYNIVSTGTVLDRYAEDNGRQMYLIKAKKARDFSLLIAYNYQLLETVCGNTTVKCYIPAQKMQDNSTDWAGLISEIIQYYSCRWGSYPYSEFEVAFVPMRGFHGMEYSGMIFLRDEFLQPQYDDDRVCFILAHEIAHQWWYAMVGNDQLAEPWLDEGLANWSAYEYLHECKDKPLPDYSQTGPRKLNQELKDIYSSREYYRTAYYGGEEFWFCLERELGRTTIDNVLRRYLAEYRYDIATTTDLLAIIKKEAQKDMDYFFNQWFNIEEY